MKKNIVVLTGSARKGGNSELLADAFIEGAKEAGHEVVKFETAKKRITGCIACNTCFSKGVACSLMDDFNELAPSIEKADVIVLSSPLYWFTFTAQIKAAVDKIYSFVVGKRPLKIKEAVLLTCGETDAESDFKGIKETYKIITDYCNWKDRGIITAYGVNKAGDIKGREDLEKAKELGKSI